jgi:hypothetical protein
MRQQTDIVPTAFPQPFHPFQLVIRPASAKRRRPELTFSVSTLLLLLF